MTHTDYKHIAAWGKALGGYSYYIEDEQCKALRSNAPINTIYRKNGSTEADGPAGWVTADDIENPEMKARVDYWAAKL